jgi:hypothetical protein
MRYFASLALICLVVGASSARAEEFDNLDESVTEADSVVSQSSGIGMLMRLKSGVNFPQENGEVTHFTPITLDWQYLNLGAFALGVEITWAQGSHEVSRFDGTNSVGLDLHKTMALTLAEADYKIQFGTARVLAGVKAGGLFYRDSMTLFAGPVNASIPHNNSKTVFTAGPSLNVDVPVKGRFFLNLSGDYLVSENSYQFGSLYAGVGADF